MNVLRSRKAAFAGTLFALFVVSLSLAAAATDGPGSLVSSSPIAGPAGAQTWKMTYRSTNIHGQPIEVTGLVIAPTGPAPAGGRPVVAWAHPTTGVVEKCAPSLLPTWQTHIPNLDGLIQQGFVVVATDYPGLGTPGVHPYLVGESEGRAVLDSVRAAQKIPQAGAGKRYAVWGHSQGGHAALFTGQMSAQYAPELQLVGVAAISPATDLRQLLKNDIAAPVGRMLTSYAVYAWSSTYQTPMEPVIHAPAIPIVKKVAQDCAEGANDAYKAGMDSITLTPRMLLPTFDTNTTWQQILTENNAGHAAAGAPVLVVQGTKDKIVEPAVTQAFVNGLCGRGETVTLVMMEGEGHLLAGQHSGQQATAWMAARFAKQAPQNTCKK